MALADTVILAQAGDRRGPRDHTHVVLWSPTLYWDPATQLLAVGNSRGAATTSTVAYVSSNVSGNTPVAVADARASGGSNAERTVVQIKRTTTGNEMQDGFGGRIDFVLQDIAGVNNIVARIVAKRSGADNTGAISFQTANAGTLTERLLLSATAMSTLNDLTLTGNLYASALFPTFTGGTPSIVVTEAGGGGPFLPGGDTVSTYRPYIRILMNNTANAQKTGIQIESVASGSGPNGAIANQGLFIGHFSDQDNEHDASGGTFIEWGNGNALTAQKLVQSRPAGLPSTAATSRQFGYAIEAISQGDSTTIWTSAHDTGICLAAAVGHATGPPWSEGIRVYPRGDTANLGSRIGLVVSTHQDNLNVMDVDSFRVMLDGTTRVDFVGTGTGFTNGIALTPTGSGTVNTKFSYFVNGTQVLASRITGWGAATNAKNRLTFDTTTVTLPDLASRVGQLIDDLMTHGLINV
jgi:hypothetical protein